MKKAVLFDIDGTVLDTSDFVFKAVQYTLSKHKLSVSQNKLRRGYGKSLLGFYEFLFPEANIELLAQTHSEFQSDKFELCKVFPGVSVVLENLKLAGFKLAAVSNRSGDSLIKSLKEAKVHDFFDAFVSPDDVENPKPHPEPLLKALELLDLQIEDAVIVGDTANDILAGKSAGVVTIGVTWGWAGQAIRKEKPDFVIDNMEELLDLVSNKLQN